MKKIVIIGSTGSIGQNAVNVLCAGRFKDNFRITGLSAHSNMNLLQKQVQKLAPSSICVGSENDADIFAKKFPGTRVYSGIPGLKKLASLPDADTVLISVVGAVGIYPLISALKSGKRVALANKESMVIAGELIREMVDCGRGEIIPIDSEHSAIFQCLSGENASCIKRLIITGSGGPFYDKKINFNAVSVFEALKHPNWKMGKKITVDSATLMNKGLEVIEASRLFSIPMEKIEILIHPQSIIHSMVEFVDGSVKALLSVPDMRLSIQYALTYPDRFPSKIKNLDFVKTRTLGFYKPDFRKFPCLALALKAGLQGGTMPAVLNASNEVAVYSFLKGRIKFSQIPEIILRVMQRHKKISNPHLTEILSADKWARAEAQLLC